jgi:hypothetical protein
MQVREFVARYASELQTRFFESQSTNAFAQANSALRQIQVRIHALRDLLEILSHSIEGLFKEAE